MMRTTRIVRAALIAGIYVVLCLVLQPFSYGPVQVRISEALTLLPVFTPDAIWAVTLGCFLSNLFSMSPWDMLFGTLATFLAAVSTYQLRHIRFKGVPFLSCLPPILFNAVIVGMVTVGLGQVVSCGILGLLLVKTIEKTPQLRGWVEANK